MSATYSLSLWTVAELKVRINDINLSLDELRPYNGTVHGADAISKLRSERDRVQAELDSREDH